MLASPMVRVGAHERVFTDWSQVSGIEVPCARPAWPTSERGSRLRRLLDALVRSRALGAALMARLVVRHRPRRRGDAPPGFRPATDPVRRPRLARDLLHDRHGTLADECDWHRLGAHAVARDAAGGVGGAQMGS